MGSGYVSQRDSYCCAARIGLKVVAVSSESGKLYGLPMPCRPRKDKLRLACRIGLASSQRRSEPVVAKPEGLRQFTGVKSYVGRQTRRMGVGL